MKFIEVNCKLSGLCRGKILLGVYRDIRVISLVSKEQRYFHGCTQSVIVSEFHEWKKSTPIVLLVVAVYVEILFQSLVGAFSLSVAFWVICGSEMKSHIESFSKRSEEVPYKFCSMVGGDM